MASSLLLTGVGAGTPASGSSSVIKSIQQGSISIAAASLTGTYTCSPTVTAANSMLIYEGCTNDCAATNTYARAATRITLTNGTTVTATRENSTTNAVTIYFTIVEFASGVNSIQYGTAAITNGNTTGTATVSAVGANAFVIWLGTSIASGTLNYSDVCSAVTLTNSTTVTANVGTTPGVTMTTAFVVVDLDTTIVSSIQQRGPITSTAAATTDTDTISSVTTANTLLFSGGVTSGTANVTTTGVAYHQTLTNGTTVTFTRTGAGVASRSHYYTAVVFASGCLATNAVQRPGVITIVAATSGTGTITSVNAAKAFVNWGAFAALSANANTVSPSLVLTNGTTVTAAVTSAGTLSVNYEVIEFA